MGKIDNMALFVQVVQSGGLAIAGRQLGLSPASMTARINALEKHYRTRLLQRTTRSISLTTEGKRFYQACLRVLAEVENAESLLQHNKTRISGALRITVTSDFGRQYIAPLLIKFTRLHPKISPCLHVSDSVINLVRNEFDLGIRFGKLPDSTLISRRLADNYQLLVASPEYLQQHGTPQHPHDLNQHACLVMAQNGKQLNKWQFHLENNDTVEIIKVKAALTCNDGAMVRQWALAGAGIAYKSIWDIKRDLQAGRLVSVLEAFVSGFQKGDEQKTELQVVYPSRQYLPVQVEAFISFLQQELNKS